MENITFIIPIHKYEPEMEKYINKACESLSTLDGAKGSEVIIVGNKEGVDKIHSKLSDSDFEITDYIIEDNTEFCNLISKAVLTVTTKYFSILEFDDYYYKNWLKSFEAYEREHTDVSVFLPITTLVNDGEDGKFNGFVNEIVWSTSFAEDYGTIDSECLKYYQDFNVTGGIIKTDDFISVGGLKPSFGIVAWYEFLMRLCFNGKKGFVIPKYGYFHCVGRKDSLMELKSKELDPDYVAWLIEQAAKECEYRDDRELVYNKEENKGAGE